MRHWTEDQFIDRLYGVATADEAHLDACPECQARWLRLSAARRGILAEPEVPADVLAAQRRAIYRRLDRRPAPVLKWAPALGAMLMIVAGLVFFRPDPAPPAAPGDDSVFSEVYSLEQRSEPLAAKPMQALFEDN